MFDPKINLKRQTLLLLRMLEGKSDAEICDELKITPATLKRRKKKLAEKHVQKLERCQPCAAGLDWSRVPKPKPLSHTTTWRKTVCRWCGEDVQAPSFERDLEVGECGGGVTEPAEWGCCSDKCLQLAWERDQRGRPKTAKGKRINNRAPWEAPE